MLIGLDGVRKRFGEREIIRGVDWQIHDGERWALVGPNGSGKSTLLGLLTGEMEPGGGDIRRRRSLRIAGVAQQDLSAERKPVREYLLEAFSQIREAEGELERLHARVAREEADAAALERVAELQDLLRLHGGYTYESQLEKALLGLGFSLSQADRPCCSFSGGEQMRIKLCRALLDPGDLLLLDEPGNHLDGKQMAWLGKFLQECGRSYVVVTHDPAILERAVDRVACLTDGKLFTFRGDFDSFQKQYEELQRNRRKEYEKQQAFIARTQEFIRRYKAGQRTKQARGREKVLARLERVDAPVREVDTYALTLAFDRRSGDDVLEAKEIRVRTGDTALEARSLHLSIGWKVALVGPNGSGKTRLLRTLMGDLEPLSGSVKWGAGVKTAHYEQHLASLPDSGSLFEAAASLMPGATKGEVLSCLGAFGFGGIRADQAVGSLSGGERARMHLLKVLLARANVLLLDEPTNHLDQAMVETVRDALSKFKGTAVLVSHDHGFLASICDHTWAIRDGEVIQVDGFSPELAGDGLRGGRAGSGMTSSSGGGPIGRSPGPSGMSKNERFRLERRVAEVEERVTALEEEKVGLEERFRDPESVPPEEWKALHDRYEELTAELASSEEEWLSLTERLEA